MSNAIKITIPEPCHENWATMTPTERGRHCAVCTKEVIDFTTKTDAEVIKLVQSNSNMCGRMRSDQVNREITLSRKQNNSFPTYFAALALPLALGFTSDLVAQHDKAPVLQTTQVIHQPLKNQSIIQGKIAPQPLMTITGVVADHHGNTLPGATVAVKNSARSVQTDFDGNYSIAVSPGESLIFSYIGYSSVDVKVTSQNSIRVHLKIDEALSLEYVIAGMMVIEEIPPKKKRRRKQ